MDEKLSEWVDCIESKGGILNDMLLKNKVLAIVKTKNLSEYKAWIGWLPKWKKRHRCRVRWLHGESFIETPIDTENFKKTLREKIKIYGEENVYNADETGIFYKLIPSKYLCKNIRNGHKILKDRISVLLCTIWAEQSYVSQLSLKSLWNLVV